jgi:O-acetyl-ADP-ribose deacetylase (regulator of RNase III)
MMGIFSSAGTGKEKMNTTKASYHYPGGQSLELVDGDITQEKVDAIVNAANSHLSHGGGVAAAIARKGGQVVFTESREWIKRHGPVSHEEPAYTGGGNLPSQYVIHAVGPIWGDGDEDEKLKITILGILRRAEELKLSSIALPAISTGIYGFPVERAANIFLNTFQEYFDEHTGSKLNKVRLVLYDRNSQDVFQKAFRKWQTSLDSNGEE